MPLLSLALLFLFPCGVYLALGRGRGGVWGLVPGDVEVRGEGPYRRTRARLFRAGEAPFAVRLAALSSLFLGQMIVPGVLVWLAGVLVVMNEGPATFRHEPILTVLALAGPTGLVVAWKLLAAGTSLLERDEGAAARARNAAAWALLHNCGLLIGLGVAASQTRELARDFALYPAACGAVCIAQALLLRRAASALEAYDRAAERRAEGGPEPC